MPDPSCDTAARPSSSPVDCPHRPPCPGCPRFGEPGIDPAARAALEALARAHGLPGVPVVEGAPQGFRLRARLAIRGRAGAPRVGMFQLATHRVVAIPDCRVHHPLINRAAAVVRRALIDEGVPIYVDGLHRGVARYLQVVVERSSGRAQVVLVANSAGPAPLERCFGRIRDELGDDLHSLHFNAQCEPTNAILGPGFVRWCGEPAVVERFDGPAVHYPPGAFGQSNLEVAGRIVGHVRALVPPGSRVTEFYAGVGAIGLSILERTSTLRLNERGAASLEGLALGLDGLAPEQRARVEVVPGAAGDCCDAAEGADVVVVDPPRKGLDAPLADRLAERPPRRLVYVSCGLASLQADVHRLIRPGGLRLAGLTAFNLMPYTAHVETVACFERT